MRRNCQSGYEIHWRTDAEKAFCKKIARCMIVFGMTSFNIASAESFSCAGFLYLVEQSAVEFSAILGDTDSESGEFKSKKTLPGAQYCVILEDPEKRTYKCTWNYSLGDAQAHSAFQQYVKDVEICLGDRAKKLKDQPVNHPDTYISYRYEVSDSEVRVTLKDKSELRNTLVSVIIEGS